MKRILIVFLLLSTFSYASEMKIKTFILSLDKSNYPEIKFDMLIKDMNAWDLFNCNNNTCDNCEENEPLGKCSPLQMTSLKGYKVDNCKEFDSECRNNKCPYFIKIFENNNRIIKFKLKQVIVTERILNRIQTKDTTPVTILVTVSYISKIPSKDLKKIKIIFKSLNHSNQKGDLHFFLSNGSNKIPRSKWNKIDDEVWALSLKFLEDYKSLK